MSEALLPEEHQYPTILTPEQLGEFSSQEPERVGSAASMLVIMMRASVEDNVRRTPDGEYDTGYVKGHRREASAQLIAASHFGLALDLMAPRADDQSWLDHAFDLAQLPEVAKQIDLLDD